MTGWVLTPGRHTISRVLTLADTDGRRAHDAYHRFVRAGRWATARLWRVLTVHAVALTCPDGVVELLVDDTLAHKSGRTVAGAGSFRDAVRSTSKRVVYAWGLNVVVVCLRVDPPWGGTPIALPLNLRIRAKKNGKKTTELAAEMVAEIAGWLPDRRFHLTGDGAYACLAGAALPRTHLTARLRRDAALYQPAPPRTGRARPAPRQRRPAGQAARAGRRRCGERLAAGGGRYPQPPSHPAGRSVRRALVRGLQGRSGAAGRRPRPHRQPTRRLLRHHRPVRHRSPDRHPLRRPIECCFKDVKQHAGAEHPQTWQGSGPARAVMLAFWLYTAVWCCYLAGWSGPTWRVRPWYTRKATPSFLDALAALRRDLWRQRITDMSPGAPLPGEILGPLLDTLAEAA